MTKNQRQFLKEYGEVCKKYNIYVSGRDCESTIRTHPDDKPHFKEHLKEHLRELLIDVRHDLEDK